MLLLSQVWRNMIAIDNAYFDFTANDGGTLKQLYSALSLKQQKENSNNESKKKSSRWFVHHLFFSNLVNLPLVKINESLQIQFTHWRSQLQSRGSLNTPSLLRTQSNLVHWSWYPLRMWFPHIRPLFRHSNLGKIQSYSPQRFHLGWNLLSRKVLYLSQPCQTKRHPCISPILDVCQLLSMEIDSVKTMEISLSRSFTWMSDSMLGVLLMLTEMVVTWPMFPLRTPRGFADASSFKLLSLWWILHKLI